MNEAALEQIDSSLRGHESLSEVDDFNGLTKKFIEHGDTIKTLRGDIDGKVKDLEGRVKLPKEDASDEERQEFTKTINQYQGVPESIEGYEIQKPDNLPEGMTYDDTLSSKMLEALHKSGAPKSLVQSLFKEFNDYHIDLQSKFNEYVKEGNEKRIGVLKKVWGENDYEAKNKETFLAISKFVEKAEIPKEFFPGSENSVDGFKKWITDSGLETDPVFNFMWNKVFELTGDDAFVRAGGISKGKGDFLEDLYSKSMPAD